MKTTFFSRVASALALALLATTVAAAQNLDENGALPRATPESVGVSSEALANALRSLDEKIDRIDGIMVLRDGKTIAEAHRPPFDPDQPHALYSVSKSFTSVAVGFAIDEGKMALDQKLVDSFPEELPEECDQFLKDVELKDLLTMTCGHVKIAAPEGMIAADYGLGVHRPNVEPTWARFFLAQKVEREPGTYFAYNTTGTYMVSAMLQKAVGQTARDYLVPRLFEPLHIETPYWESSPQGVSKGGTGLYLKLEDVAKFGQFLLQRGQWNGEQLLSAEWIDKATSKQVATNPNDPFGYGFQFWRGPNNIFYALGMLSQFCIVAPDQNAAIAILGDHNDMQSILAIVNNELIPALNPEPREENPEALAKLREVEKSFQPKEGESGSLVSDEVVHSEKLGRDVKYRVFVPNEYRTSSRSYPTLYLLHGMSGSEKSWSDPKHGRIKEICDAWFRERPEQKRIVIMPDAEDRWYRDSADDSWKYESFFFDELIPDVQRKFRCKTDRADRAIAGQSMGGYGALLYALHRPDMFSVCCGMGAAIRTRETVAGLPFDSFVKRYRSRADSKETDERFDDYFFANDPFALVENIPDDQKGSVRFLLDCGDDDGLLEGAFVFFQTARAKGVPCELRVGDGKHDWNYWRAGLLNALQFIAEK